MAFKWTPQRIKFCTEYMVDHSATGAAERAGYSKKTARQIGSLLLTHIDMQEKIKELTDKKLKKTNITVERILDELDLLCYSNVSDCVEFDEKGELRIKQFEDMPPGVSRTIESITQTIVPKRGKKVERKIKIKLWSKPKAVELSAKYLKMLTDNIDITDNRAKLNMKDLIKSQKKGE